MRPFRRPATYSTVRTALTVVPRLLDTPSPGKSENRKFRRLPQKELETAY